MNGEFIKSLICPYCSGGLKTSLIVEEQGKDILSGILQCECNRYPILSGILIFKDPRLSNDYIIRLIEKGNTKAAIAYALNPLTSTRKIENYLLFLIVSACTKFVVNHNLRLFYPLLDNAWNSLYYRTMDRYREDTTFFDALSQMGLKHSFYYKNRFSYQTFQTIYPVITILKRNKIRGKVMDIGCGMGHAAYHLLKHIKPKQLICLDYNFTDLYLARRFIVKDKNSEFISTDINLPLPFRDKQFLFILMSDLLQSIPSQTTLALESERVLADGGIASILHCHNKENKNPFGSSRGFALTYDEFYNLFPNLKKRILPEKQVLEDYILENKVDLIREHSLREFDQSEFVFIGAKRDDIFRIYNDIMRDTSEIGDYLTVNPIFNMKKTSEGITLSRLRDNAPVPEFKVVTNISKRAGIPEKILISQEVKDVFRSKKPIPKKIIDELPQHVKKEISDLIQNSIIINVPKEYL